MGRIERASLLSLEAYARQRDAFRARVIEHKRHRSVSLGEHVTLLFEDELTIRYQVQEMLRIERIFEEEGIQHELQVYNPLVPDGGNLKATMLIEYPDPAERQVADHARVHAIADEDLEREDEHKTSAVHFLRFELDPAMRGALRGGARLALGIDHPQYQAAVDAAPEVRAALAADLS